jgi:hypothetical protein
LMRIRIWIQVNKMMRIHNTVFVFIVSFLPYWI